MKASSKRGRPKKIDEREALRLYESGLNDRETGKQMGVSKGIIQCWRKQSGLPPNGWRVLDRIAGVKELYDAGLCDREIAEELGVSFDAARSWRLRRGFPPVGKRGRRPGPQLPVKEEKRRETLFRICKNESAVARRLGISRQAVNQWRQSRGLASKREAGNAR